MSSILLYIPRQCRTVAAVKGKPEPEKTGAWVVKNVPGDLMRRARMAALMTPGGTVRELIIGLVETHVAELEKKGTIPKPKS